MTSANCPLRGWAAVAVMILLGVGWLMGQEVAGNAAASDEGTAALAGQAVSQSDAAGTARTLPPMLPRQVRFSGVLQDGAGAPLTGVQGVTFALYAEQVGGAPLWLETQTVEADAQGHYSVLLGAMRSDGLPQEVFTTNEARWLGVQASQPGVPEQARVLLVSVPYALKAADAETLGGLPATAYALTGTVDGTASGTKHGWATAAASAGDTLPTAADGTSGNIAKFDVDGTTLVNSVMKEVGGNIGVVTTLPVARLTVADTETNRSPMAIKHQRNTEDGDWVGFEFLGADDFPLGRLRHVRNVPGQRFDFLFEAVPFGGVMTEVARFTGQGRLGIGTTDPVLPITAQDLVTNTAVLGLKHRRNSVDGDWVGMDFLGTDNQAVGRFRNVRNEANNRFDMTVETVAFGGVPTEVMRFTGNGDVGIGTASPTAKLDVNGTLRAAGTLTATGQINAAGTVTAAAFVGDGSGLTGIGEAAIADGSITSAEIADSTVTSTDIADGTIANADIDPAAAIDATKIAGTAATLGVNAFVGDQSVTGNVTVSGGGNGYIFPDASKQTTAASANTNIRGINYIAGCDTCATLADPTDDQKTIYQNVVGDMNITEVTCFANAGSPTINLQRDDGSAANILVDSSPSAAIACDGTAKTTFNGTENELHAGDKIDFNLVTASTASRVTVVIKAVVQ